jgi:hypothetical protein
VPLTQQPVIQLTDLAGNSVSQSGTQIVASVTTGAATLGGTTTVGTDANGSASFLDLSLSGPSGSYTITFRSTGVTPALAQVVSGSIALGAGGASKLVITTQPSANAQSGSVLVRQPVLQLQDGAGNPVAQPGVVVHAAVTGATLGGNSDATTDANGVATFSGLSITGPAGTYHIDFSGPSLTGVQSNAIVLSAGLATALSITTQPSAAAQSGVPFPRQPVIQLQDAAGNNVAQSGVSITAAILTGPGGVLSQSTITVQTDANGVATFVGLKVSGLPGTYTFQFSGPSQTPVTSDPMVLSPGPASVLAILTEPSAQVQNTLVFPRQPVVQVQDGTGNAVAVAGTSVKATIASGGGTLGGTATVLTDGTGTATFGNLVLTGSVGTRTLSFTATGLTGATSIGIDVIAGPATTLAVQAGDNQTATAGSPVATPPAALVTDASGNPVAGVTVTFAVASGGGSVGGATPVSDVNGLATVGGWTLGTVAGANSLTATAAGLAGSPLTFHATGVAGSAGKLAIIAQPSSTAQSGSQFLLQPAIQLQDALGNPLLTNGVGVTATASAGTLNGNTTVTTVNGVATFTNLSITGLAGNYTLTFSGASLTGVTSNPITLSAGAAARLVVTTQASDTVFNTVAFPQQPVVTVEDQAGNPANGTHTISTSIVSGGGSLSGSTSISTAGGSSVSFTDLAITGTAGPRTLLFSASGLTSVSSDPIEVIAGGATQIAAASLTSQAAIVGTPVPAPPSVVVRDASGNPVAGVTVTFAITAGGGSLNGPIQVTDGTGVATVGDWTLGPIAGTNTVTATATGTGIAGNPVSFNATGTASTASVVVLNAGNGQSATVGTAVATLPSVKVTDANGNAVNGFAVSFAVGAGGGSITGANAVTNPQGIAAAGSWTLGTTAGTNTLTATATGLSGSPISFTATGVAGPPSAAQTSATVPPGTAGQPTPISIVSRDQFGNPRLSGGATVVVSVTGANAAIPAVTDNGDGTYSAAYTPTTAGNDAVAITLNGVAIGGSPYPSVVAPATATKLGFLVQPSAVTAGQSIAPAVQVAVQDANGNTITGSSATVSLALGSNPGGATLTGGNPIAVVNGVATFSGLSLDKSAAGYTLVASSASLTSATSSGFTVNPGPATHLSITVEPSATAPSGVTFPAQPVIQLRDALGNAVSQQNVAVSVTASGGTLNGTASANTNANGTASFGGLSITGLVGNYTLTFQATGLTPITSTTIALSAGAASTIAKSAGDNQTAPAGTGVATAPAVLVTDDAGNPVSGVSVGFAVAPGSGSVVPTAPVTTDVSGIAAVTSWTLGTTAGANSLTATSSGLSGSPLTFHATGTTGSATQLVITTQPASTANSGIALTTQPVVQLQDGHGNNVAQAGVSVAAAIGSGGGTLGGTTPVTTDANGTATFTNLVISGLVGTRTLQFSSGILAPATSTNIVLSAGNATTIAVSAGDNQSASVGTPVAIDPAVLVTDGAGNPVSAVNVTFAVVTGGGTVVPTSAVPTNSSGIATVTSWTLGNTAGTNTLRATSGTLGGSPVTFTAQATAGAGTKLVFTTEPTSIVAGSPITPAVQVTIQDNSGNTVTGATNTVTLAIGTNPGGGTLSGTASVAAVAGVATFPGLSIDKTGTGYALTASASGLTGATSTAFNVAPGAAAALEFQRDPSNTVAGSAITPSPQVAIKDALGNTVTGATTAITLAIGTNPGGGTLSGTLVRSAVAGVATFPGLSIDVAANGYTLTADGGGLPQVASTAFDIQVGTGNKLDFIVQPTSTTVGAGISPSIEVAIKDGAGNVVTSAKDQITLVIANNPGGAVLHGTTSRKASNGIATFNGISLTAAGSGYTLSALATGLVSATSTGFDITSAASTTTITSDTPDPSRVGQAYTVNFTVSSSGGTPTGTVTVSDGLNSCNGALASGAGSCQITSTTAGGKTLVATYPGDASFTGSNSVGTAHTVNAAATTLAITSDAPEPSVAGGSVVVNWTLSVSAPGGGTPTGNVTITVNDASGATCSAAIAAGTCSLSLPLVGNKTLTATYPGDGNFNGSSDTEPHVVSKSATTVAITADTPDPSAVGAGISVSYAVAATAPGTGTPTGNVTVSDGTGGSCVGTAAAGGCTLTPTTSGAKNLVATYAGDANYSGSISAAEPHTVSAGTSTTTITNDTPDPSTVGQSYTVSYSVSSTGGTPTGNVTVSDGAGASCIGTVAAGSCSLASTTVGAKTLTATYAGDANFGGSTSAGVTHGVNQATTTTAITNDTPDPSAVGQAYTVSYLVTSTGGTPTGNVTVSDGAGGSCIGTVAAGSCSLTSTAAGAKTLTASYAGDANFSGSASAGTGHSVTAAGSTTTITGDSPDPTTVGEAYTVSFTVTSGGGSPTGNVTVSDGTGGSCIGTVAVGSCPLTSTTAGAKTLSATYAGDANFGGSISAGVAHTVNQATSTTAITSDTPDPSTVGQAYTVSYSVTSTGGTPTGNVTVSDGAGGSCIDTVAAGSCSLTSTTAGAKTLTASYAGDANFSGSISAGATHGVNQATTTTAILSDNPDPSSVGQDYTVAFSVTSSGGTPSGNVTVSDGTDDCTALVSDGSCLLNSSTTGAKTLVATYAGDANFSGSASTGTPHNVNAASTTTTITGDSPDPTDVGDPYTVSFTVTSTGGSPSGNVTVSDGTDQCVGTVAAGSCSLTSTTAGAKTLTATYAGNGTFNGSTSAGAAHTVNQAATTTSITGDSPDPSTVGDAYTVNFSVTSTGGTPSGNVTVSDGTDSCIGTVAAGSCSLTSSTTGTPKTLVATYAGSANFAGSTSGGASHTVNPAATTTSITAHTPNPSVVGQPISVSWSVASGFGSPGGTVSVSDGTDGCSDVVGAGGCSFTPTTAGVSKTITATYGGDATHTGSSDNVSHEVDAFGPADAAHSTASVPDGNALIQTTITIQARDQFGNAVGVGGATVVVTISGTNSASASVTDNGDGTYTATYTPILPGTDSVDITLDGGEISGSPFTSNVGL